MAIDAGTNAEMLAVQVVLMYRHKRSFDPGLNLIRLRKYEKIHIVER